MEIPEPVMVGDDRYRLRRVRSGCHLCFQAEWQRDFRTLKRRRVLTPGGAVLEFLAPPPWESSARLFADSTEAVAFVTAVLEGRPLHDGPRGPRGRTCRATSGSPSRCSGPSRS